MIPLLAAFLAVAQPNIIVVMTDDQDDHGSLQTMQNVQKLQQDGLTFVNSFSAYALCAPSRASFLTGMYAHNHHIIRDHGAFAIFQRHFEANALPVKLHNAGYTTALIGKYINDYGAVDGGTHISPGWDDFQPMLKHQYYHYDINNNGTLEHYGGEDSDYSTGVLKAKALDFISTAHEPFFLLVTPRAPHGPFTAAPGDQGTYATLPNPKLPNYNEQNVKDKPRYIQDLPLVDDDKADRAFRSRQESLIDVDRLVASLRRAASERGNCVFVYTSDNGYSLGSHRWMKKNLVYDEANRVPLIIAGLGAAGETRDQLVNNLDLVATIEELAGIPVDGDGASLLPVIEHDAAPWRDALLVEGGFGSQAVRSVDDYYIVNRAGFEEYYNVREDPWLMKNKADKAPSRMIDLRKVLSILKNCSGVSCFFVDGMKGG